MQSHWKVPKKEFIFNKTAFLTPGNLTKKMNSWRYFSGCLLVAASAASNIWQR